MADRICLNEARVQLHTSNYLRLCPITMILRFSIQEENYRNTLFFYNESVAYKNLPEWRLLRIYFTILNRALMHVLIERITNDKISPNIAAANHNLHT